MSVTELPSWIRARVQEHPDAVAVVDGDREQSYAELWQGAEAAASALAAAGVVPGDLVAIQAQRGADAITAMLGAWLAGAGYLILDPALPELRRAEMMRTARPRLRVSAVPGGAGRLLIEPGATDPYTHPVPLAYAVFTSGSTGAPKAVLIEQSALAWHSDATKACFDLTSDDRILHAASLSFDVSAEEIWPTLACGATVVVLPGELSSTGYAKFTQLLDDRQISVCNLPASYFGGWASAGASVAGVLPRLRLVIAGSETLAPDAARQWLAAEKNPLLVNAYGTSETTITSVVARVTERPAGAVPLGWPLPGVEALVVSDDVTPVAKGEEGELLLSGAGLAFGYLGAPELTGASFVRHEGKRWYRTGDRVVWTEYGLMFLGRCDDQFKLRGRRIEPGEITAAILADVDVIDARVVLIDDQIVACVTARETLDVQRVLAAVGSALPAYMVPAAVLEFDAFPVNAGGKVDLPSLRAAARSQLLPEAPSQVVKVEDLIALCMEVLQTADAVPESNFFDLGGTSLHAAKFASVIFRRYAVPVSLETVFSTATLAELAHEVNATAAAGSS